MRIGPGGARGWSYNRPDLHMNAVLVVIALLATILVAIALLVHPRSRGHPSSRPGTRRLDLDDVQFTVYRPRQISAGRWYSLLAFAHLTQRPARGPPRPHPLAEAERQRARTLALA